MIHLILLPYVQGIFSNAKPPIYRSGQEWQTILGRLEMRPFMSSSI